MYYKPFVLFIPALPLEVLIVVSSYFVILYSDQQMHS